MEKVVFLGILIITIFITGCIQQGNQVTNGQNNSNLADCSYTQDYEVPSPKLVKLNQDFDLKLFQSTFIQDTYNQVQFTQHIPACSTQEESCYQTGKFSVNLYHKDWQALYIWGEWKENNTEFSYEPLTIRKNESKIFTYPNIESSQELKPLKVTVNSITGKCLETTANLRITEAP